MNMLSVLEMDAFNPGSPSAGIPRLNVYSSFGKHSQVINSIVGENVDIQGKIENSLIFSNVRVAKDAVIRNSSCSPATTSAASARS